MNEKETKQHVYEPSEVIEDLTLNETESGDVKGGGIDMFLKLDGIKGESKDLNVRGKGENIILTTG